MANYQALGTSPVSFVDDNQKQQEIPLSAISFGANGVNASSWPLYSANQPVVDALLNQMVAQGLLVQGTETAPMPAMTVTAAGTGTNGNMIKVTFSNPLPAAGTVTVAVSATEVYPGLTLATLSAALGASAPTANGLVFLEASNSQMPVNFTGPVGGGPGFNVVVPDAASDPAGAFTLQATDPTYTVEIAVAVDPSPATTFTLTVTGSKTVAGATLATLETAASNPFATLVKFSGPAGGPLPAPGTVTLQGGAPAMSLPAEPAEATVFSS